MSIRRKTYRLDQERLDRAKRILGTRTETETIEQALDLVIFREEVLSSLRNTRGALEVDDPSERLD